MFQSEDHLVSAALALGASTVTSWTTAEERLARDAPFLDSAASEWLRRQIEKGGDPLGEMFCRLRRPEVRRERGATYTPPEIVRAMVRWARGQKQAPRRIVDPGVGSGRFLLAAGKAFPDAELIGVDVEPLATLIARANLCN